MLGLETFDSNTDLLVATVASNITNVLSGSVKPVVPRQIQMNVYCHWRLYSPSSKTIIEQYQSNNNIVFDAIGPEYTLQPPNALHQTAYAAGQEYVSRFLPSYYSVRRDLYKRGKGASNWLIRQGFRRAEVANWEGAIDTWTQVVNSGSLRNAGRACLNIAVGYEVLGKTSLVLQWAKRGFEDYRNKLCRGYAKILLNRQKIEGQQ